MPNTDDDADDDCACWWKLVKRFSNTFTSATRPTREGGREWENCMREYEEYEYMNE